MSLIETAIFYVFAFLSLYVQVFLLLTFIERRKEIVIRRSPIVLKRYPKVTIIVPCYNEEKTIAGTVRSLLSLNYPKDKLDIILIDDGSTDNTWKKLQAFSKKKNIRVFHKENGGKHTAINLGLAMSDSEFVGGLDSDSYVHPEALKRIISVFASDKKAMAVCPSIIVHNPSNYIQRAQRTEYDMSIFTKKMLGFVGGIHVTPGPFSIFRREVFDNLGPYKKAHNTEDQEIALRMQVHGYKIEHCPDAYVYTMTPDTIPKLYRQRLRWIYGFIKNAYDYRHMWFRRRYGTVGILTIPAGMISIWSLLLLFFFISMNLVRFFKAKILAIQTVGFSPDVLGGKWGWFYMDTGATAFMIIFIYGLVFFSILMGRRMSEDKARIRFADLYFIIVYRLVAPFWILKALWNAFWSKESDWRYERRALQE